MQPRGAIVPIQIDDVITSIEVELEASEKVRDKAIAEVKYILKTASDQGRANLTHEEDGRVEELFTARDKALASIEGIKVKLRSAQRARDAEADATAAAEDIHDTGVQLPAARSGERRTTSVSVGRNERTYRPDTDSHGIGFLRDVCRSFLFRDAESQFRLDQHMAEERVEHAAQIAGMQQRAAGDSTTANWAGLTVPQYLTDMYAPAVAAMRPFADICQHYPLPPDGMTVNISQVTTPSSVDLPTSELPAAGVAAASIDDTLLTENVQTAAGQVTLSRQAVDRGTGIEAVTMNDLFRRYATRLDTTMINQTVTGLDALATGTTTAYTTTGPTVAGLYPKILGATAAVEAALLNQARPTHVIMHSRRWYWMASQLVSTWPLINTPPIGVQAGGQMTDTGYNQGIRGILPAGLDVVVDNNISTSAGASTNQDAVYVVARDECHLWEDPAAPVYIRAEQPKVASLGVLLVLYGYFAYTLRRFAGAVQSVSGTGLVTPTF